MVFGSIQFKPSLPHGHAIWIHSNKSFHVPKSEALCHMWREVWQGKDGNLELLATFIHTALHSSSNEDIIQQWYGGKHNFEQQGRAFLKFNITLQQGKNEQIKTSFHTYLRFRTCQNILLTTTTATTSIIASHSHAVFMLVLLPLLRMERFLSFPSFAFILFHNS